MKNTGRSTSHCEGFAKIEHEPTIDENGPSSNDIVETILGRNERAKQLLASRLVDLGLSEKSICRVLNLDRFVKK